MKMHDHEIADVTTRIEYRRWLNLAYSWVVNFLALSAIAMLIGGDALSGHQDAEGRYLLAERGRYTAVSAAVWYYSLSHTTLTLITAPFAIYAALRAGFVRFRGDDRQGESLRGRGTV